jgi:restriction endonuclease
VPNLPTRRIRRFIVQGETATTAAAKGRAWEDLASVLFEAIPGLSVTHRNVVNVTVSEEIDVALWNEGAAQGLKGFPEIIFVEVKNWSAPVDAQQVTVFDNKVRRRGLTFGILVAAAGITGNPANRTAAHAIAEAALLEGRRIIVITRADIEGLNTTADLVRLIKKKVCALVASGTSLADD